jgi:hypothetical protein
MSKMKKPESFVPKIYIILSCELHSVESYRDSSVSTPIARDLVPRNARTVEELNRERSLCRELPNFLPRNS